MTSALSEIFINPYNNIKSQYVIINETTTVPFDVAKEFCENIGGNLISVTNRKEFDFILNFMNENDENIWLGLQRLVDEEVNNTLNPQEFNFIDGSLAKEFLGNRGEFPWAIDRPNNGSPNQRCVTWFKDAEPRLELAGLWDDIDCNAKKITMCKLIIEELVEDEEDKEFLEKYKTIIFLPLIVLVTCILMILIYMYYMSLNSIKTVKFQLFQLRNI